MNDKPRCWRKLLKAEFNMRNRYRKRNYRRAHYWWRVMKRWIDKLK